VREAYEAQGVAPPLATPTSAQLGAFANTPNEPAADPAQLNAADIRRGIVALVVLSLLTACALAVDIYAAIQATSGAGG
jgi:hypothetical protein